MEKMNPLAHILISYIALSFFIPDVNKYLWPIVIFSELVDLDHIPGLIKYFFMTKKQRQSLTIKEDIKTFRSFFHEVPGIILIEMIILLLYFIGINKIILFIAAAAVFLHWLADFLMNPTRPLYPFSKKIVYLFPMKIKTKLITDWLITLILLIIAVVIYF